MSDATELPSDMDRLIKLERADAARHALENAAARLEAYSANRLYERALRIGARMIRDMIREQK